MLEGHREMRVEPSMTPSGDFDIVIEDPVFAEVPPGEPDIPLEAPVELDDSEAKMFYEGMCHDIEQVYVYMADRALKTLALSIEKIVSNTALTDEMREREQKRLKEAYEDYLARLEVVKQIKLDEANKKYQNALLSAGRE